MTGLERLFLHYYVFTEQIKVRIVQKFFFHRVVILKIQSRKLQDLSCVRFSQREK